MADLGTLLTMIPPAAWQEACEREAVIRPLTERPKLTRAAVECAAAELGLNRSRIFELVGRYRSKPVASSLLDQGRGFPKGQHRLSPRLDGIISAEIDGFYLARPKPSLAQLVRSVRHACQSEGIEAPSLNTIVARAREVDAKRSIAARDGAKAAADRFRPVTRSFDAEYPLHVVQMDHTPADVIIVDEHFRRPLGRPILTLQIDVATRTIPGFYVSLEHPSATSVGMAIRHAVLPKTAWLQERDLDRVEYPVAGIPDALHLDNAKEFHSLALNRGCRQHGIELIYRPVRTPHYGGHIERLIGTTVGEIHLLPGTTFSNVKAKGDYNAEGKACLTLPEFERWLTLQIAVYHGTIHGELGVPPLTAWHDALAKRPTPLRYPINDAAFLLNFLPFEMRKVRREGIELFHAFYWHGTLAALAVSTDRKRPVKYNPLNLSAVYLELSDGEHLTVPLRDRRRPAITKFEHDAAVKALRERGRLALDEHQIFEMVKEQRTIVRDAIARTKTARKAAQRTVYALSAGAPVIAPTEPRLPKPPDPPADTERVVPFDIEERG